MAGGLDAPFLITGAAGFIGSALIWELNRSGRDDIVACDLLDSTEKWKNLVPLRIRDYLEADELADRVGCTQAFLDRFGTIVHLGACSSTTESNAAYLMKNNYGYTKVLAEAAAARGVRFVYASSAATYGALEHDLSEARPLHSLRPLNMYAYSKHLFDLYAERTGLLDRITGIKYFNVYGPNEAHKGEMRSMVVKAFEQIRATGCVRLFRSYRPEFADGEQQRDFLYVKDAVRMTLALAAEPRATGIFNVGSGRAATWLDLIGAVFAALGRAPQIEFIEMPEFMQSKYQYRTEASIERAAKFGIAPHYTLADGVADYVLRYLKPRSVLDPAVPETEPAETVTVAGF